MRLLFLVYFYGIDSNLAVTRINNICNLSHKGVGVVDPIRDYNTCNTYREHI